MTDLYNKPSPSDILIHEGIEGMKWGVRNGPPYPLTRGQASASEKKKGFKQSKFAKSSKELKKDIDKMSDEELNTRLNRLEREKRYKTLLDDKYKSDGQKYMEKIGDKLLTSTIIAAGTVTSGILINTFIKQPLTAALKPG